MTKILTVHAPEHVDQVCRELSLNALRLWLLCEAHLDNSASSATVSLNYTKCQYMNFGLSHTAFYRP